MYNDWSSRQSACEAPPEMCIHQLFFVLVLEDKFLGEIKPGLVHSLFLGGHFGTKPQRLCIGCLVLLTHRQIQKEEPLLSKDLVATGSGQEKLSHTTVVSRCPEWSQEPAF